ncbi:aldo/keto reductase [Mucilaginibacter galii]|uniref:Aldo/keto reductase n=1 Tax=Mucilaginibacter galii TaxID=2005073 RepID=A0A917JAV7_9SPHI|nr:aldo/keto reductase [Mucilaginibacter galii]GGI51729.1 aldo/keto reductase [Mucilaginibacter galii]
MNYKILGSTGLKVSVIGLGTMNYGGKGFFKVMGTLDQAAVDEQFKVALEHGINFIDTANVYSEGLSEEMIGQAVKNLSINRDDLVIATKVRGGMGNGVNDRGLSRKHIIQQVEASLIRLKTDYIDLYQIHSADPLTPVGETLETLDVLVKSGKVRYTGASNMTAWNLMKTLAHSQYNKLERFASLQANYSIVGRELEREMVPLLRDQNVGLLVWSPLASGWLTGKYQKDAKEKGTGRIDNFKQQFINHDRLQAIFEAMKPMVEEKNSSFAQLSLAWLLHQPVVTSIIIGATKISQLTDNLKALDIKFSSQELSVLNKVSAITEEYPGNVDAIMSSDRKAS